MSRIDLRPMPQSYLPGPKLGGACFPRARRAGDKVLPVVGAKGFAAA
jgi:hypothetical protein